jgi:hypothetical protein
MGGKVEPRHRERTDEGGRSAHPSSFSISTLTKVVFLVKEKIQFFSLSSAARHSPGKGSLPILYKYDIKISKKMQGAV